MRWQVIVEPPYASSARGAYALVAKFDRSRFARARAFIWPAPSRQSGSHFARAGLWFPALRWARRRPACRRVGRGAAQARSRVTRTGGHSRRPIPSKRFAFRPRGALFSGVAMGAPPPGRVAALRAARLKPVRALPARGRSFAPPHPVKAVRISPARGPVFRRCDGRAAARSRRRVACGAAQARSRVTRTGGIRAAPSRQSGSHFARAGLCFPALRWARRRPGVSPRCVRRGSSPFARYPHGGVDSRRPIPSKRFAFRPRGALVSGVAMGAPPPGRAAALRAARLKPVRALPARGAFAPPHPVKAVRISPARGSGFRRCDGRATARRVAALGAARLKPVRALPARGRSFAPPHPVKAVRISLARGPGFRRCDGRAAARSRRRVACGATQARSRFARTGGIRAAPSRQSGSHFARAGLWFPALRWARRRPGAPPRCVRRDSSPFALCPHGGIRAAPSRQSGSHFARAGLWFPALRWARRRPGVPPRWAQIIWKTHRMRCLRIRGANRRCASCAASVRRSGRCDRPRAARSYRRYSGR